MTRKKILLIDDNCHTPTGGAFLNRYEYAFLQAEGFEVASLSFPASPPKQAQENDYVFLIPESRRHQKMLKFIGGRGARQFVAETIAKFQPDAIHCHLISVCPAEVYAGIGEGTPVIQTLHGPNLFCATSWGCRPNSEPCELGIGLKCFARGCATLPNTLLYMNLKRRYWESMCRAVDVFHCPSRHIRNSALRLGLQNCEQITLCINESFMDVSREMPTGPPTAIFAGSLEKCKGVHVLLQAMRLVLTELPDARLLIAGRGSQRDALARYVRDWGLAERVSLLGRISHDVLLEKYRQSDVLVVPSIWQEQYGMVGPEAMACGLPCIGSDIGGIAEWLRHGEFGQLVPPGQVRHLAEALIFYLTHREQGYAQGQAAQAHARTTYDPHRYRRDIVDLILKVIDER